MDGVCSIHGVDGNAYKISVGNPDGKRLVEMPRHRWRVMVIKWIVKEQRVSK
jgi:hypothetical protein